MRTLVERLKMRAARKQGKSVGKRINSTSPIYDI